MDNIPDTKDTASTNHLLTELDHALSQSSVMRNIVNGYQLLHCIESITGPSRRTRMLRKEIEILEDELRFARTS